MSFVHIQMPLKQANIEFVVFWTYIIPNVFYNFQTQR